MCFWISLGPGTPPSPRQPPHGGLLQAHKQQLPTIPPSELLSGCQVGFVSFGTLLSPRQQEPPPLGTRSTRRGEGGRGEFTAACVKRPEEKNSNSRRNSRLLVSHVSGPYHIVTLATLASFISPTWCLPPEGRRGEGSQLLKATTADNLSVRDSSSVHDRAALYADLHGHQRSRLGQILNHKLERLMGPDVVIVRTSTPCFFLFFPTQKPTGSS